MAEQNLEFYTVNLDYLEYLSKIDSEVYYVPSYRATNHQKPFLGTIVGLSNYDYFIPIASAKPKHLNWNLTSDSHYIIHEIIDRSNAIAGSLNKPHPNNTDIIHILAILDIKKMIPIKSGLYTQIDFSKIQDIDYKNLLQKEYNFCSSNKANIINTATKLYTEQINNGIIRHAHCNYSLLEQALKKYNNQP